VTDLEQLGELLARRPIHRKRIVYGEALEAMRALGASALPLGEEPLALASRRDFRSYPHIFFAPRAYYSANDSELARRTTMQMRQLPTALLAAACSIAFFGCASRGDNRPIYVTTSPEPRSVSATGEAEVRVVPDEIVFTVGVETNEETLAATKSRNDEAIRALQAAAVAKGVLPKDMQTEYVEVEPRYDNYERRNTIGYTARKTVVLTLRDLARFEPVLDAVVAGGANRVLGISFRTSELRKHRDEARALAVRAAREKAQALAKELDQEIDRPHSIDEEHNAWFSPFGSWWAGRYGQAMQNVVQNAGPQQQAPDGTIAPGQISVTARVRVVFELK
jgi:hypothetical protein